MNAKDRFLAYRGRLNSIRMSNRRINEFRFTAGERGGCTWEHELRKFQICWELKKRAVDFVSEAIFENGARADVVDLTNGIIYEVLHTETLEEAKHKESYYPELFEIRYIKTSDNWETRLLD